MKADCSKIVIVVDLRVHLLTVAFIQILVCFSVHFFVCLNSAVSVSE